MCEFISAVKKGQKYYYMTKDYANSPLGKTLKKRFPGEGELIGHSAIRAYFDLVDGEDVEFTDFSIPNNFPKQILKSIANGDFAGFAIPERPEFMLSEDCLNKYPEWQAYDKARKAYDKARQAYGEARQAYDKAYQAYDKALTPLFWELFKNPDNRTEAWKNI